MQTFLPYPSFQRSAKVLDRQRLGKQRVETLQLLYALTGKSKGWANHPACKMWRGYTPALVEYGLAICVEWHRRGYVDTCYSKIAAYGSLTIVLPPWLGNRAFHRSHKSNLIRKLPSHYSQFWNVPNDLPYVWPI